MTVARHQGESIVDRARRLDVERGYATQNVGVSERIISGVSGAAFLVAGLRKGTVGGAALSVFGGLLLYRAATGYCGAYRALGLDSAHEGHALFGGHDVHKGIYVRARETVDRSPEACYRFWRDFQNLPRFMTHLEHVHVVDQARSRWEARSPGGVVVGWDAELINDRPNELIAWKSVGDSDVAHAGSVRFRPAAGGQGTEISIELQYEPRGGRIGALIARLLGEEPEHQVRDDLRRFKQLIETGAPPTGSDQPRGHA